MKAGASVRGMETTLEGSTVREVLETCVEAASFTSPMACKQEDRSGQTRQSTARPPCRRPTCPGCWLGPQRRGLYREPHWVRGRLELLSGNESPCVPYTQSCRGEAQSAPDTSSQGHILVSPKPRGELPGRGQLEQEQRNQMFLGDFTMDI